MVRFEDFEIAWIYDAIKEEKKAMIELYKNLPKQQEEKEAIISELDEILRKIKTYQKDESSMSNAIRSLIYKQD